MTTRPTIGRLMRLAAGWLAVLVGGVVGEAADAGAGRTVVFGTVERHTQRGAPVRMLDDAAFDQELAEMVAKAAGLPLRFVEFKTAPEVLAAFERGEIDAIPSMARLPEREAKYLFSVRHTVSTAAVFVRSGAEPVTAVEQLATLRLAVMRDSSASSYVRRKGWLDRVQQFATTEEAMQAVVSGRAEACVSNQLIGLSVIRGMKLDGSLVPSLTLPDSAVDFCMVVRRTDAELLARLNDGLVLAFERGDMQRHREKWLPVFESYWLSRGEVRRWGIAVVVALALMGGWVWLEHRARQRADRRRQEEAWRNEEQRARELALANERLRASEELFSTAFRASPDAISITRLDDGRIIDVNDAFTRMFGYAHDEVIGRTRLDFGLWIRPEERTPLRPTLREQGRVREAVQRVRCKDGREIEVLYSTELTKVGGAECSVTISRDVTEQKRTQDELVRGLQFNEAILNTVDGLIIVLDRKGRIVRFNPACERLTGWRSAEMIGRCFWELLVPPEQVDGVRSTFAALSAGMFPIRYENDWILRDGSRRWIAWANSALLDSAGAVDLVLGTGVDITSTRHMTEALRASEERYQLAVRGSSAGLWDWNMRTDEVFYAPRFREMLGYSATELPDNLAAFFQMLHPDDRPLVEQALAENHSPKNVPFDVEYRLKTKSGEYRWFHARGEVLRDEAGRPYRMAGSIVDVSPRKEAETELRHLNAELEARVRERTVELAGRVVEVEQLNAELEAFSYSVSHDLRAPLRNITGFLELLERRSAGRLDAEETRYVQTVTREAARLGTLIDELLTFSRMGRAEMKPQRVPLAELVTEVRAELQSMVGARVIEWKVGALPVVEGDRALLRLVVSNLLGNAVKFTRRRAVAEIELGVLPVEGDPRLVTICVRDNGAGFNAKYTDKLFGVFQRLHNQRDFEGTGIGLANVKRIVTRHGGRVWAEGKVDKGAVFYFNLRTWLS